MAIGISACLAGQPRPASSRPKWPEKLSLYRLGLKSFLKKGARWRRSHASVVSVLNFFRENETVYMVMNYLEAPPAGLHHHRARPEKPIRCFARSTIRSLFDEVLRGLCIVHQHKDAAPGHQASQHLHHRR